MNTVRSLALARPAPSAFLPWLLLAVMLAAVWPRSGHAEDMVYTFRPGDSLWKVCEQYARDPNACWQELAQRNGIATPRAIPAGARLRIPAEWLKAQPEPAQVSRVSGQVWLYRKAGGDPEQVGMGAQVDLGDALETASNGYARVEFADESWIELRPDTLVVFDRYSRFREYGMVDTSLRLERGDIRTYVKPRRSGESRYIITTPSAVAAVRGTEFDLSVDSQETLRSEVKGGTVAVEAQGEEQLVPAGYATLARAGEAPLVPVQQLPAPVLAAEAAPMAIDARWESVPGASSYRLEVYSQADSTLVTAATTAGTRAELPLPAGDYRLVARAVDDLGLRGMETTLDASALAAAPEAPQKDGRIDIWVFGAAALWILAL